LGGVIIKSIHVSIFCDESKNRKISATTYSEAQNLNYIGMCIVPTSKINEVANKLNNLRCGADKNYLVCGDNCKYHKLNKRKIHYTEADDGYIYKTACKWTNCIVNNFINKEFYINILGIDYCKLDKTYFKSGDEYTNINENIYCRFFRTTILYGIKYFFSDYDTVIIDNIYHDIGEMEYHKYFRKQVINYANWNEDNIAMGCKEIRFLATTNDNCLDSNNIFLQLVDLFLGETIGLIHGDVINNRKKELALKLFPIVDHCLNRPNNPRSKYHKLYYISFFPKYKISDNMDELEKTLKKNDNFFNNMEIKLSDGGEQLTLF